mgnify:CR=1 FL=1
MADKEGRRTHTGEGSASGLLTGPTIFPERYTNRYLAADYRGSLEETTSDHPADNDQASNTTNDRSMRYSNSAGKPSTRYLEAKYSQLLKDQKHFKDFTPEQLLNIFSFVIEELKHQLPSIPGMTTELLETYKSWLTQIIRGQLTANDVTQKIDEAFSETPDRVRGDLRTPALVLEIAVEKLKQTV